MKKGDTHRICALVKWVSIGLLLVAVTGCQEMSCSTKELSRQPSPDGTVQSVVSIADCGATTSTAYTVHVINFDGKVSKDDEVFRADKVDELKVEWERDKVLNISYKKARIFFFTNFWQRISGENVYQVNIREQGR